MLATRPLSVRLRREVLYVLYLTAQLLTPSQVVAGNLSGDPIGLITIRAQRVGAGNGTSTWIGRQGGCNIIRPINVSSCIDGVGSRLQSSSWTKQTKRSFAGGVEVNQPVKVYKNARPMLHATETATEKEENQRYADLKNITPCIASIVLPPWPLGPLGPWALRVPIIRLRGWKME